MRYYVEQEKKKKILLYRYICWLITPCGKICRSNNQERDNKCVVQNTTEKWNIVIKHICSIKYEMDKWNLYKKGKSYHDFYYQLVFIKIWTLNSFSIFHLIFTSKRGNRCRKSLPVGYSFKVSNAKYADGKNWNNPPFSYVTFV